MSKEDTENVQVEWKEDRVLATKAWLNGRYINFAVVKLVEDSGQYNNFAIYVSKEDNDIDNVEMQYCIHQALYRSIDSIIKLRNMIEKLPDDPTQIDPDSWSEIKEFMSTSND